MPTPPTAVFRPSAEWGAVAMLVAVSAWVAYAGGAYSYDDAFITYRMAENLASGQGFVYNPGEWHLGSTAALYGILLAGGARIAGAEAIPALSGAISCASMLATALLLPGLASGGSSDGRGRQAGYAAGMLYLASPLMFVTFGGEMPFLLALATAAFVAADRGHAKTAAALASATALTRPDGMQVVMVVLATIAWRRRRLPLAEAAVAFAVLLPFALLAWHAYGSPLPSTVGAKLAQRDSGLWGSFGRGLIDWLRLFLWDPTRPNLGFAPVTPPLLWACIGAGAVAVWRLRPVLPLLGWTALFTAVYATLRVPFYHWYAAPAVLGLAIVGGAGLAFIVEAIARRAAATAPWREAAVTLGVIGAALAISLPPLLALPRTSQLNENVRLYIRTGEWLAQHTPAGSHVGYYEIGYIGFHGRRPMVDALGLIDPTIAPAIRVHDFARAFREARPEYILEKPGAGLNTFLAEPWFQTEYRLVTELQFGQERLRIHRR